MFCDKCYKFWQDAFAKAGVPAPLSSIEDIHWEHHEVKLHSNMRELKTSSDIGCTVCRTIFASPTHWELEELLAKEEEELSIVLELEVKQNRPVVSATFFEPGPEGTNPKVRLPKRMLASGSSLLQDGEPTVPPEIGLSKL